MSLPKWTDAFWDQRLMQSIANSMWKTWNIENRWRIAQQSIDFAWVEHIANGASTTNTIYLLPVEVTPNICRTHVLHVVTELHDHHKMREKHLEQNEKWYGNEPCAHKWNQTKSFRRCHIYLPRLLIQIDWIPTSQNNVAIFIFDWIVSHIFRLFSAPSETRSSNRLQFIFDAQSSLVPLRFIPFFILFADGASWTFNVLLSSKLFWQTSTNIDETPFGFVADKLFNVSWI